MTKTSFEDLPQESSEGLEPEQSNVPHTEEDLTPYLETIRQIEAQMRRQGIVLPRRPAVQLNDPEPKLIPNPYPDPKDMLAVLSDFIRQYLVCSHDQLTVLALWVLHTHTYQALGRKTSNSLRKPLLNSV